MIAYSPGVEYAWAHIRHLERARNRALSENAGNYEALTRISQEAVQDIHWWLDVLPVTCRKIRIGKPDVLIYCDASGNHGWGAVMGDQNAGARWSPEEQGYDNNIKETLAVKYSTRAFTKGMWGLLIKVFSDNQVAVKYVEEMGGLGQDIIDRIAREIWEWCAKYGHYIIVESVSYTHLTLPTICSV